MRSDKDKHTTTRCLRTTSQPVTQPTVPTTVNALPTTVTWQLITTPLLLTTALPHKTSLEATPSNTDMLWTRLATLLMPTAR
jgi:hypothetical protein